MFGLDLLVGFPRRVRPPFSPRRGQRGAAVPAGCLKSSATIGETRYREAEHRLVRTATGQVIDHPTSADHNAGGDLDQT